jgi:hypothetical protein
LLPPVSKELVESTGVELLVLVPPVVPPVEVESSLLVVVLVVVVLVVLLPSLPPVDVDDSLDSDTAQEDKKRIDDMAIMVLLSNECLINTRYLLYIPR